LSKYAKADISPYGVIKDTSPFNVEAEWTHANNVRFDNGSVVKYGGEVEADATSVQALHLQFNGSHEQPLWYYMADASIYKTEFSGDTLLGAVTSGGKWDSTLFNNIPVFNNELDIPWVTLDDLALTALPNFPPLSVCKAVRPYKSFLVALNLTDNGVINNNRILWSDSSDGGDLPASWDISDPSTLAGDAWLTSSKGEVIDGLQLRDLFVIYKTHSTYIMRLISGQSVMKIEKIQVNSGILAKNCVAEFKGIHFVVSDADVVLFDGQSVKSIADKRVRAEIFTKIDTVNYANTYVVRYDRQDEMWICYPEQGQEYPNRAAIWNWKDDTWAFRDLSQSRHIASGVTNFAPGVTWDSQNVTWDSQARSWNPLSQNPTTDTLVSAATLKLGILDQGNNVFDVAMNTTLEKTSMDFGDPDSIKIIKTIRPRITANAGTSIYIRVGVQFNADDPIQWNTERLYTVGTDREAYFTCKGRYISVRFRTQDIDETWALHGFTIETALSGNY